MAAVEAKRVEDPAAHALDSADLGGDYKPAAKPGLAGYTLDNDRGCQWNFALLDSHHNQYSRSWLAVSNDRYNKIHERYEQPKMGCRNDIQPPNRRLNT